MRKIQTGDKVKVISGKYKGILGQVTKVVTKIRPGKLPQLRAAVNNIPMGVGTGSLEYFMFPVKPGRIIFEVSGAPEDKVREAFRIAGHKLPFNTKIISRNDNLI